MQEYYQKITIKGQGKSGRGHGCHHQSMALYIRDLFSGKIISDQKTRKAMTAHLPPNLQIKLLSGVRKIVVAVTTMAEGPELRWYDYPW